MFSNKLGHVEKAISKKHVSTLIGLSSDKDQEVCLAAIAGLGDVGGDEAMNHLISCLQNTNPKVRIAAAQALGELGDKHSKAFVSSQMNKEEDPDVRQALSKALSKIRNY